MLRQCAWCLRLKDRVGEPTSSLPVAKIYEASHAICKACGNLWLEHVFPDTEKQAALQPLPIKADVTCLY